MNKKRLLTHKKIKIGSYLICMSRVFSFIKLRFFYSIIWLIIAMISLFFTLSPLLIGQKTFNFTIMYYTNWSCWLSFFASIVAFSKSSKDVIFKKRTQDNEFYIIVVLSSSIMITATFFVIFVVSLLSFGKITYSNISGLFVHCILPLINLAYPFFFLGKSKVKFYHPLIAIIPSLIYWSIIFLRVIITRFSNGGHIPIYLWSRYYPYPFTNLDSGQTLQNVLIAFFLILFLLLFLGYSVFFISKFNKRKKKDILKC